jgi:hypothetical protein
MELKPGYTVRAFDPRTLGVVKYGRVESFGSKYARIDFGMTGTTQVALRDVLEVVDTRRETESTQALVADMERDGLL